jgi:hypothetical protein
VVTRMLTAYPSLAIITVGPAAVVGVDVDVDVGVDVGELLDVVGGSSLVEWSSMVLLVGGALTALDCAGVETGSDRLVAPVAPEDKEDATWMAARAAAFG